MPDYSNVNVNNVLANCNHCNYDDLLGMCLDDSVQISVDDLERYGYKEIDRLRNDVMVRIEEKHWAKAQGNLEDLLSFIDCCEKGKYSQNHLSDAHQLRTRMAQNMENNEWESVRRTQNIDTLLKYIERCEQGVYSKTHLEEAKQLVEILEWKLIQDSGDPSRLSDFIVKCRSGVYSRFFLDEAEQKLDAIKGAEIQAQWNEVASIVDEEEKLQRVFDFIQQYKHSESLTAQRCMKEANKLYERLEDNKRATADWLLACQVHDIMGYVDFVRSHPYCKYVDEANKRISDLKSDLMNSLRRTPFNFPRPTMYKIVSNNILTKKELVDQSGILTEHAYKHILDYPTVDSEQRLLPMASLENPYSHDGNTDIIFFGVSGSGKTCVLSSLFSLDGNYGFSYDPKGDGGGGNYAMELHRYAKISFLPPRTDGRFIQVIDAEIIDDNSNTHPLAFIEMSGEKTAEFAMLEKDTDFDDLGPGAAAIFKNNNRKLIFFVVDPVNEKDIIIESKNMLIQQSQVLNCIARLLERNPAFMQKVIAMHVIVTKSDTLGSNVDASKLFNMLRNQGYEGVMNRLNKLSRDNRNCNQLTDHVVGIYPFHVGNFLPGEVYTLDDSDAKSLLTVIRDNSEAVCPHDGWLDRVRSFFNR